MSGHNVLQDVANGQHLQLDPGAGGTITVKHTAFIPLVSAGAEARALSDPDSLGQDLTLRMITDGGDITLTADTAFNQAGNTILTFGDVGDTAFLRSVQLSGGAYRWQVIALDGITAS